MAGRSVLQQYRQSGLGVNCYVLGWLLTYRPGAPRISMGNLGVYPVGSNG